MQASKQTQYEFSKLDKPWGCGPTLSTSTPVGKVDYAQLGKPQPLANLEPNYWKIFLNSKWLLMELFSTAGI